jgi:hypothetical protein
MITFGSSQASTSSEAGMDNENSLPSPFSRGTPRGQGYTLTEAYYNTTPDASIQVGDTGGSPSSVPEIDPASAGSVLSLVMGSLAMLERRRLRRAKAAEGDAAVSA